jgi:predicted flavoprotein YhiN
VPILAAKDICIEPFRPSNSGVLIDWPDFIRERFAGTPIKRVAVTCAGRTVRGELVLTAKGLEGGPIYALSRELRASPELSLDLRADLSREELDQRLARPRGKLSMSNWLRKSVGLTPGAIALMRFAANTADGATIKAVPLTIRGFDHIDRAISSAGGIARDEVDAGFELRRWPGVYAAGEMLDWEAPTGGYLLQACFAMGVHAARACLDRLDRASAHAASWP